MIYISNMSGNLTMQRTRQYKQKVKRFCQVSALTDTSAQKFDVIELESSLTH